MLIKKVNCKQFGGLQKKSLEFSEGLNLFLGDNETGKSTMIDLMYHLLFKEVSVRKGSHFQTLYFPKKSDGISGNFVEGNIIFETDKGAYDLRKKWKKSEKSKTSDSQCELTLPDGRIIDEYNMVERIVLEEMIYGKGIFDEVVFGSQKRAMTLIQGLFLPTEKKISKDNEKKTTVKTEISSMVTRAVMETGGISVDKLEKRLKEILTLYDESWDFQSDTPNGGIPNRGIGNKWPCAKTKKAEKGEQAIILTAYYEKEELEDKRRKAKSAEDKVDEANRNLAEAKQEQGEAKNRQRDFQKYKSILENRRSIKELKKVSDESLQGLKDDLKAWPVAIKNYETAKKLKTDFENAGCRELYNTITELQEKLKRKNDILSEIGNIEDEDVERALNLKNSIEKKSGLLRGLNITAKIRQLGDIVPEVRSADTGSSIEIKNNIFDIKEAVEILVPGVMELQLMPSGINVDKIKQELSGERNEYTSICHKYSVGNASELQQNQIRYKEIFGDVKRLEEDIKRALGNVSWEELQEKYVLLPQITENVSEIDEKVKTLCKDKSIEVFCGIQEEKISELEQKYGTEEELLRRKSEEQEKNNQLQATLESLEDVPKIYKDIDDPEKYDTMPGGEVDSYDSVIEKIRRELSNSEKELGEQTSEEYSELLDEKREYFEQQKAIYSHWKNIYDVVRRVKETMVSNPMKDIEDKFREYLGVLSDGAIILNDFNDHMDSSISSGNNQLAYDILSEGTRDTIALALRLAVLEHLYPDGGGLAVFDDPFTDMDPDRTRQACRLIKKFAENNQVIFVTCDPKYGDLMKVEAKMFK